MTEAIFGLVGVVVGGVLNGVIATALDRGRQARAARTTARLAIAEMHRNWLTLADVVVHRQWGPVHARPLTLEEWQSSGREVFANVLRFTDWLVVWKAYRGVEQAIEAASGARPGMRPGRRPGDMLSDEQVEWVDRTVHDSIAAAMLLTRVGVYGTRRRPFAYIGGWMRGKVRPRSDDELLRELQEQVPGLG